MTMSVWGIEIGQAGLKAIRLRFDEAARQVVAVAFDYIPHAKIHSQPDAVPEELIQTAITTFLSRNDIKGASIAIGISGQMAVIRFLQLPPIESSKVSEIVRYEAKQQIPFPLEDVIWDYQTLGGGIEESGFMLDAEVGVFAMKKEIIASAIKPYVANKVEVDVVQIAPLAMHAFFCFDRLGWRKHEPFEPLKNFTMLLDMGTDSTSVLVTNGQSIWIRHVPIGGGHFTRSLSKAMKLTFAKAEHLKRNAKSAPDPRAVFQSMQPVFHDYQAEIQRTIGYFHNRVQSRIESILCMGNGFQLGGLRLFLEQQWKREVTFVERFDAIVGDAVLESPLFQDNSMTFVVPYGLALQQLGLSPIHTSLLPAEIRMARMIRRKKPWMKKMRGEIRG